MTTTRMGLETAGLVRRGCNMGFCKQTQMDCMYTDRDNNDICSLDVCKFNVKINYNEDGNFTTEPAKTEVNKGDMDNGK